jgi:hypothetical protein
MERDAALELVNRWHDLPNKPEDGRAYQRLAYTATNVLPSDITAGGAALVEDVPTVLALNASSVFALSANPTDDGKDAAVTVRRFPLAGARVVVELLDDMAGELPGDGGVGAHLRQWTFRWDTGEVLSFDTVVKVYNGWSDRPEASELFARALAGAVGWGLPDADA